jgi:2-polyprenyl-3-methyl-5-hydroxy-6-metoxy-1,4-benzoquinol methylase
MIPDVKEPSESLWSYETEKYQAKPFKDYFEQTRSEMLEFVPSNCRRALDVGCSSGGFAASLKNSRGIEVWGIEPFDSAAIQARPRLDNVIQDTFPPRVALPEAYFDCVIFNDVLEHLVDPESAIRYTRRVLTDDGVIVASIPNIRHFPTMWNLLVHGEWNYGESGTLDRTHLRFFTRSSIVTLFESQGYRVEKICGIKPYFGNPNVSRRIWAIYELANLACLKKFNDAKFECFAVVARKVPAPKS